MRRCPAGVAQRFAVALLRLYQMILSPFLGNQCRFYPSCSQYAIECLKKFGLIKGAALAVLRLLRCQPFARGGIDPVPEKMIG